MLRQRLSPEQISGKLKAMDIPDLRDAYACRETIYKAIYALPVGQLRKELTHYRMTKREEKRLQLEVAEGDPLKSVSNVGSGKPHDPEKQRLDEIIERLNDLYGAEVSDDDKLHFATGIADRISRDEAVMAQVNNHTPEQVMHGLLPDTGTGLLGRIFRSPEHRRCCTYCLNSGAMG